MHSTRKRLISLALTIAMIISLFPAISIPAFAADTSGAYGDNISWAFDESTGTLEISGSGELSGFYNLVPWYDYNKQIKSIVINKGITSINYAVFRGYSVENLFLPEGLLETGQEAFYKCSSLKNVTIPDGVKAIGNVAFANCTSLENVILPDSVNDMGSNVFLGCENLTTAVFEDGITEISDSIFWECANLTNVTIPSSVKTIGANAFRRCQKLNNVVIPDGVTTIGESSFSQCKSLESMSVPESVKTIGDNAFGVCTNLKSISIPDSVEDIGLDAFSLCESLESINIPNNLEIIKMGTFLGCSKLVNINIPDSVKTIGAGAFAYCVNLESINIPAGVTKLSTNSDEYIIGAVFEGCSKLADINIDPNNDSFIFEDKDALFYALESKSGSYTIPDGVKTIEPGAFFGSNLDSVTIPASVTDIGQHAFHTYSDTGISMGNIASVYFLGSAPSVVSNGNGLFASFDENVTLYYYKGMEGWTTPTWNGYNTVELPLDIPDASGSYGDIVKPPQKQYESALSKESKSGKILRKVFLSQAHSP